MPAGGDLWMGKYDILDINFNVKNNSLFLLKGLQSIVGVPEDRKSLLLSIAPVKPIEPLFHAAL